jgi:hypothetical protein
VVSVTDPYGSFLGFLDRILLKYPTKVKYVRLSSLLLVDNPLSIPFNLGTLKMKINLETIVPLAVSNPRYPCPSDTKY